MREFEEKTQGKRLAIGDIKAILARIIRQDEAISILRWAEDGSLGYLDSSYHDATVFDQYRNNVWSMLRYDYPTQPDFGRHRVKQSLK